MRKGFARLLVAVAAGLSTGLSAAPAAAAACIGTTFGSSFAGSYTCNNIGSPSGVSTPLGGITFLNNNTLLIGGSANNNGGYIAQIGVTRDAGGHIIGFSGPSTSFAAAPYIDGGLAFGPSNVLFATGYPNNTVLEYRSGSASPDRTINLTPLGVSSSVGALQFVPTGFAGAGGARIVSYNTGNFYDAILNPDGSGTYNLAATFVTTLTGGPEGIAYVTGANPGFGADSMLLSQYTAGSVAAYGLDSSGNPTGAPRTFLSGLSGAEGAAIDPLTGDFIFSTFGSSNGIFVISGFTAPPQPGGVPEPATWAMMLLGFGAIALAMRRTRRSTEAAQLA